MSNSDFSPPSAAETKQVFRSLSTLSSSSDSPCKRHMNESSASVNSRKKVRRDIHNKKSVSCGTEIREEKKKVYCHVCSDPVECEYCYDWIVLKYTDNPLLQNICKSKWQDVIHAEYRLLNNYTTYKKKVECGCVSKQYNTRERRDLPSCLYDRIDEFIEDQLREQSLRWHEAMINKLSYSDSVQKDFIK